LLLWQADSPEQAWVAIGSGFSGALKFVVMGAANPRAACALDYKQLRACKKRLGLNSHECYDHETYNGECDALEAAVRKCVAFEVAPRLARVSYDATRSRSERMEANRELQHRIKKYFPACAPKVPNS